MNARDLPFAPRPESNPGNALGAARFASLGPAFYSTPAAQPLAAPRWVTLSTALAREIGLDAGWSAQPDALDIFSGNTMPGRCKPLATVYSGHQFGVWAGQLGDGRALLLGETRSGLEVQLKGAGRTPYSRMGDGRAVLRSSIREFLASEAMHALGIPTTRALCIVGSDTPVRRETMETAAVVTRLAPSFIRFGHFEHFAAAQLTDELRQLADFVIDAYYPQCRLSSSSPPQQYAALLQSVAHRTADLVAAWQSVGFCHGVMNTDNMSILGLTLDYGPFQFMDGYDPAHICNHSDEQGRYAYARQPQVAHWNLYCLGQALMPLIQDQDTAVAALDAYAQHYPAALQARLQSKLGLLTPGESDRPFIEDTLRLMARARVDHTQFWRRLGHHVAGNGKAHPRELFADPADFDRWLETYEQRMRQEDLENSARHMLGVNPKYVLRNHLGEMSIRRAQQGDFTGVDTLLSLLERPFDEQPDHEDAAGLPPDWASSISISCSS